MHVTGDAKPYTHHTTSPCAHTIIVSKAFFFLKEKGTTKRGRQSNFKIKVGPYDMGLYFQSFRRLK